MALLEFWKNSREAVLNQSIQQVVTIAGDGNLSDDTTCSMEFVQFLREAPSERLFGYAQSCLDTSFDKSGFALQDIINELGRRLGFVVENGRYRGVKGQIGFDGVWRSESRPEIVIEVKTTSAYQMSVDTFADYRQRLIDAGRLSRESSILIIVGRFDTEGLEAQVRGSKHAWDVRLISIESLIRLVKVKEMSPDPTTLERIGEVLRPFEYTRVDKIIDIIFATAEDVEGSSLENEDQVTGDVQQGDIAARSFEVTPKGDLENKRMQAANAFAERQEKRLVKFSKTLFQSGDGELRVCVAVSKNYLRDYQPYWYAYHPKWDEFLRGGKSSFLLLACMDREDAFAIPYQQLVGMLPKMNQTKKDDGKSYWHIAVTTTETGLAVNLSKVKEVVELSPYRFRFGHQLSLY